MLRYVLQRLLLLVAVAIGVSLLAFFLLRVVPGDVATAALAQGGAASEAHAQELRATLGLDRPLYVQYLAWARGLLSLDLGRSLWTGLSVWELVSPGIAVTLELAALTLMVALSVALVSGVLSALYRDTWVDYFFRIITISGLSAPGFWIGILVVLGLAAYFQYFPFAEYRPFYDAPWPNLQQFLIPALVLGWRVAAVLGRMVRSSMLEVLGEDYIRTARSKGLGEGAITYRHALRNAALPTITLVGMQMAYLMGGVVVMEQVFNLPGVGRALVDAVRLRDYPVVQFLVMFFALVTLLSNLAVDLLYAHLDPRIRYGR